MAQKQIGMNVFDEVKRLIVIAAHPDDLETMCGGTIAMLVERGVELFSVNCTLGDIGTTDPAYTAETLAAARLRETETAAAVLKLKQTFNLGHSDGELLPSLLLRAQIANLYRTTQADTLFTFDPYWTGQVHPDHRAAAQAAIDAYMPSKMPLYRPEQLEQPGVEVARLERVFLFGTNREPEVAVDVTAVYPTKIAACLAHKSQFGDEEALEWMKKLDEARAEGLDATYVERFKQLAIW